MTATPDSTTGLDACAPPLSDEQLLDAVRAYSKQVPAQGPYGPTRTIAGSLYDQPVPSGVSNPLWEIVRLLPTSPHGDLYGSGILRPDGNLIRELLAAGAGDFSARYRELEPFTRRELCRRYSWAIPSPADIAWMVRLARGAGRGIVEVGAGSGYWAWQLRQVGVDVVAYDPHPPAPDNGFASAGPYTEVLQGDHTAAFGHEDRILFLCWPPYCASWPDGLLAVWGGADGHLLRRIGRRLHGGRRLLQAPRGGVDRSRQLRGARPMGRHPRRADRLPSASHRRPGMITAG